MFPRLHTSKMGVLKPNTGSNGPSININTKKTFYLLGKRKACSRHITVCNGYIYKNNNSSLKKSVQVGSVACVLDLGMFTNYIMKE